MKPPVIAAWSLGEQQFTLASAPRWRWGGELMASAFRGELGGSGNHAEYVLLDFKLASSDVRGATLYSTLEPCSTRNHPKVPCAQRIVDRGVTEVVIGTYDPNPRIYRAGWRMLRDAGVRLRDFPPDLRAIVEKDNVDFLDSFRRIAADKGTTPGFDYTQNGGRFLVRTVFGDFDTRWTGRSGTSVYAVDNKHNVAEARFARRFEEIDDHGALDFGSHSVAAHLGEIVVFRNDVAYLLVKALSIGAGPTRGHALFELKFEFETRGMSDGLSAQWR